METGFECLPASLAGASHEPVLESLAKGPGLRTGMAWLDTIIGGFERSHLSLVDGNGPFVGELTASACVQAAAEGEVVFLDGGNSIDLYAIAAMARARGLDPGQALSRISVSRAFTAYQMATLIHTRLAPIIEETGASALLVSNIIDLFLDKDMRWGESFQLIKSSMGELKRLAREYELAAIVTNRGFHKLRHRRPLRKVMLDWPDRAVILEERGGGVRVILPRVGIHYHRYRADECQSVLDSFHGGMRHGQDRSHL